MEKQEFTRNETPLSWTLYDLYIDCTFSKGELGADTQKHAGGSQHNSEDAAKVQAIVSRSEILLSFSVSTMECKEF